MVFCILCTVDGVCSSFDIERNSFLYYNSIQVRGVKQGIFIHKHQINVWPRVLNSTYLTNNFILNLSCNYLDINVGECHPARFSKIAPQSQLNN